MSIVFPSSPSNSNLPNGQFSTQSQVLYGDKRFKTAKMLDGYYPKFTMLGIDRFHRMPQRTLPEEPSDLEKTRVYTAIEFLDLQNDCLGKLIKKCLSLTFTFKEYMEYALFDPHKGYYTMHPGVGTDFQTTPTDNSPYYGHMIAEMIMKLWKGMVEAGTFRKDEKFDVCELGAGKGILARDIVHFIRNKSFSEGGLWHNLYNNLNYVIGDISPELRKNQIQTTEKYKDKISVIELDARDLKKTFSKGSLKGVILSNELPDAFACHKIRKRNDGIIELAISVPVVTDFKHFITGYQQILEESGIPNFANFLPRIIKENADLQSLLVPQFSIIPTEESCPEDRAKTGYLSKQVYKILRKEITSPFFDMRITWKEFWIPIYFMKELEPFCITHYPFLGLLAPNSPVPLNSDLRTFQEGCGHALEKGFQLTIDYQYDCLNLLRWGDQGFRTYPSNSLHNYSNSPGEEDITHDVNATALAVEGVRAGLQPFLFCTEEEMVSMFPALQSKIKLPEGGLPFYSLLLKKKNTKTTYDPSVLTLPVTYRDLMLKISDWSAAGVKNIRYLKSSTPAVLLYQAYKLIKPDESKPPLLQHYQQTKTELLRSLPTKSIMIRECINSLFPKLFFGNDALFDLAKEYKSVSEFEYTKIIEYFISQRTSDKADRLMIQLVRQLLHFYYSDRK
jgi:SAM-dependent MidA family methyltransferase